MLMTASVAIAVADSIAARSSACDFWEIIPSNHILPTICENNLLTLSVNLIYIGIMIEYIESLGKKIKYTYLTI